jgi:diaminopimelate epimerase
MTAGWIESAVDLPFLKVSAGGNDFVLVDNRNERLGGRLEALVRAVCHRRLGVGADGMILIEVSRRADLRMAYFNRDGGAAELCGNGLRCVARWAALQAAAPDPMTVETGAGILIASGKADPPWFTFPVEEAGCREMDVDPGEGAVRGLFVPAGVPHFAVRVGDSFATGALDNAPALRSHPAFGAAGANVDIYTEREGGLLEVRYFERGVEAETLSSGTGSIAAAVAAHLTGSGDGPFTCRNREGLETRITLARGSDGRLDASVAAPVLFLYHGRLRRDLIGRACLGTT